MDLMLKNNIISCEIKKKMLYYIIIKEKRDIVIFYYIETNKKEGVIEFLISIT